MLEKMATLVMKEMGESSTKLNNEDNQMGNYNNKKRKVLQINNGNPTPKNTTLISIHYIDLYIDFGVMM